MEPDGQGGRRLKVVIVEAEWLQKTGTVAVEGRSANVTPEMVEAGASH